MSKGNQSCPMPTKAPPAAKKPYGGTSKNVSGKKR